jgi:peptide-methionine (S)-S-oxide reductase
MFTKMLIGTVFVAAMAAYFGISKPEQAPVQAPQKVAIPEDAHSLIVGGGCFWCIEAIYDDLDGVYEAEAGYAGGSRPNVTYEQVITGVTGHAEVIKIFFDPKKLDKADLLRLFFVVHDPTTLNRQGPDVGPQYRSVVFYSDVEEYDLAMKVMKEVADEKVWRDPIVTTLEPLRNYTRAEEYHQDYFARFERATPAERARMNVGYCANVIQPKVREFRQKFSDRLKKKGE